MPLSFKDDIGNVILRNVALGNIALENIALGKSLTN